MMKRFLPVLSLLGVCLMPLSSFAATPQQILDTSVRSLAANTAPGTNIAVELNIASTKKLIKQDAGATNEDIHLKLVLTIDSFKRGATTSDGIVMIRVPAFQVNMGPGQTYNIPNPLTIELRSIGKIAYVRVSDVSPLILAKLPSSESMGFDVRNLIDTWLSLDAKDSAETNSLLTDFSSLSAISDSSGELADLKAVLGKTSFFQVTSLEKRTKNAKGENLLRLRVRLNPGMMDQLLTLESNRTKALTGRGMTTKQRNLAKAEMQKAMKPFQFVAVVNSKTNRLERLEGAYVKTDAVYRYDWKKNKEIKIYNGTSKDNVRFGISFNAIPNREVPVPAGATSLKALIDQWTAANIPTPVPAPEPVPAENYYDYSTPEVVPPPVSAPVSPVNAADHIRGNGQAAVTIIEYADFECPFCSLHESNIKHLLQEFPQDVRLVYRHYPLASIHPSAQISAEASECAARVGGAGAFWSMHDFLFQSPANLGMVNFTAFATQLGLDTNAFQRCMTAHEGNEKIAADQASGDAAGVAGTPATFINGTLVSGAVPYETLRASVVAAGARY